MNVLLCDVKFHTTPHWVKIIRNSENCFPTSFGNIYYIVRIKYVSVHLWGIRSFCHKTTIFVPWPKQGAIGLWGLLPCLRGAGRAKKDRLKVYNSFSIYICVQIPLVKVCICAKVRIMSSQPDGPCCRHELVVWYGGFGTGLWFMSSGAFQDSRWAWGWAKSSGPPSRIYHWD